MFSLLVEKCIFENFFRLAVRGAAARWHYHGLQTTPSDVLSVDVATAEDEEGEHGGVTSSVRTEFELSARWTLSHADVGGKMRAKRPSARRVGVTLTSCDGSSAMESDDSGWLLILACRWSSKSCLACVSRSSVDLLCR